VEDAFAPEGVGGVRGVAEAVDEVGGSGLGRGVWSVGRVIYVPGKGCRGA